MASDPLLPLFRSLRTAIVRSRLNPEFDGSLPLDDYYFSDDKLKVLDTIQGSSLDLTFPSGELSRLQEELRNRMNLATKECAPYVELIQGQTYRGLFTAGLGVIQKGLNAGQKKWVGFNDNWVIEFFPLLARAFPTARFIIMLRDPRGAVASALRQKDANKIPFIYSFCRHWRKYAAFTEVFQTMEEMKDRFFFLSYEQLVKEPEETGNTLCKFLDLTFEEDMLDTTKYRSLSSEQWINYSNFDVPEQGIYTTSTDSWKKHLSQEATEFVEFVCEPEMRLFDYSPLEYQGGFPSQGALKFLYEDDQKCMGWRGHYESLEREVGFELLRKQFLLLNKLVGSEALVRKLFLFNEVFDRIKQGVHK